MEKKRNYALDGLRGVAALIVVIHHTNIFPGVLLGQFGVAIFFVLSGYLMSYLHLQQPFTTHNVKAYAINRFTRIAPIYWLAITISIVIYQFDADFVNKISGFNEITRHFLFMGSEGVFWSISPEVQFYILFIGIWFAFYRFTNGDFSLFAFVLLILFLLIYSRQYWPGLSLPSKLHLFVLGTLAGFLSHKITAKLSFIHSNVLESFLTLLLLYSIYIFRNLAEFYNSLLIGLLIFALILVFSKSNGVVVKLLSFRIFIFMGNVSFSVYLFHTIIIDMFKRSGFNFELASSQLYFSLPILLLAILVPAFISVYIELPMSKYFKNLLQEKFL